jgi:hypothetical protein
MGRILRRCAPGSKIFFGARDADIALSWCGRSKMMSMRLAAASIVLSTILASSGCGAAVAAAALRLQRLAGVEEREFEIVRKPVQVLLLALNFRKQSIFSHGHSPFHGCAWQHRLTPLYGPPRGIVCGVRQNNSQPNSSKSMD